MLPQKEFQSIVKKTRYFIPGELLRYYECFLDLKVKYPLSFHSIKMKIYFYNSTKFITLIFANFINPTNRQAVCLFYVLKR